MTLVTFRLQFPEFQNIPDAQVTQFLSVAASMMDLGIWGNQFDQGQAYLAAHLLVRSAFGQSGRMIAKDGAASSTYKSEYDRLVTVVAAGYGRAL